MSTAALNPGRRCMVLCLLALLAVPGTLAQPMQPEWMDEAYITSSLQAIAQESTTPAEQALRTAELWKRFGDNLEVALASRHEGLQQGALRMIISYGAHLQMSRLAVYDVMRLYRDEREDNVRRMAVVALGQMKNGWALAFLDRAAQFEASPCVLKAMKDVVAAHRAATPNG